MKKFVKIAAALVLAALLAACVGKEDPPKMPVSEGGKTGGGKIVGKDIRMEDITDFYYTEENINYDAYYQRYRFYAEDGKHMFFHETRERKDDYGPCTEEDTTLIGTVELTKDQWTEFTELVKNGIVTAEKDSAESGGTGPWLYLYWKNDKGKYQEFSFESYGTEGKFEEFCRSLASNTAVESNTEKEEDMTPIPVVGVRVGDRFFTISMEDNSSAGAFIDEVSSQELTVKMHDYGSFEKVGDLPFDLPVNDEKITTVPGDLILYQGRQITIYYDENTWDFTRLGRLNATPEEIREVFGGREEITAEFTVEWTE